MTNTQAPAIDKHKLIKTMVRGPFSTLQKNKFITMVARTASSDIEQPTIEMIFSAFLCPAEI